MISYAIYGSLIFTPYWSVQYATDFGSKNDSRKWLFTDAVIKNRTTAEISITNDYGSEDLTATLKLLPDGSYELIQNEGSTLKIVEKRKWVKIPKKIILTR